MSPIRQIGRGREPCIRETMEYPRDAGLERPFIQIFERTMQIFARACDDIMGCGSLSVNDELVYPMLYTACALCSGAMVVLIRSAGADLREAVDVRKHKLRAEGSRQPRQFA